MSSAGSSSSKHTASFSLVMGGKLKLKGEKKSSKGKKRSAAGEPVPPDDGDGDEDGSGYSADPLPGTGKLATSGVVVMGVDTEFTKEVAIGDTLLATVVDRYRNTEAQESRVVNMVLGKSSLNLEAPFSCDVTSPVAFLVIKKAPDVAALKQARAEERKRAKAVAEAAKEVTYKVVKPGSGTWKKWETVTEKVAGGMSREEMLRKRVEMKADRFCK
eukprot:CAMPEP_0119362504 /NCGR_PEP_ID=MMETSP1334-20130426/9552_1 /TAXON_ID=127549 /ORGANISM="Calcidiscus leptoporus, Strain RCC1130" /LENGTH=215 /DNA_ID=CAMNT_0007377725 /DNA_START=6 /DNA_END=653 /DNA_ORIENTATION=-